jgi:glycosyltransferase involved in cell wall biosynthesis
MPYAVDNHFFQTRAAEARQTREAFRQELGLEPGRPIVLYASKLMRRKHPATLLEAFATLTKKIPPHAMPYLLFVGSGEEEESLKIRAKDLPEGIVRFLGFQNQTALPRFYDVCDLFVLASEYEPWGLVVNEVMNAGKPLIVSDQVGAARDLVQPGKNGWVIPAGAVEALHDALYEALQDPDHLRNAGQSSLETITKWGIPENIHSLTNALKRLCQEDTP